MVRRLPLVAPAIALLLGMAALSPAPAATLLTSNIEEVEIRSTPRDDRLGSLRLESPKVVANVSVNGRERGTTPLSLENLTPGIYLLGISADGYESAEIRLRLAPYEAVIAIVTLAAVEGLLTISTTPDDAEILIDGEAISREETQWPLTLPIGRRTLRVRAFGYLEESRVVDVDAEGATFVSVTLPPALFEADIVGLPQRRPPPSPADPVSVQLVASAPGTAHLRLFDLSGSEVYEETKEIRKERTVFEWDGTSEGRATESSYRVSIRCTSADGRRTLFLSRVFLTQRTSLLRLSPWSLSPGLLFVPVPDNALRTRVAVGSGYAYVPSPRDADSSASMAGLLALVSVSDTVNVSFGSSVALFEDPDLNRMTFATETIWQLYQDDTAALALRGRVAVDAAIGGEKGYRPEYSASGQGVSLGPVASYRSGSVVAIFAPEAGVTWMSTTWTPSADDREWTSVLGSRAGVAVTIPFGYLGLSGRGVWYAPRPDSSGESFQLGVEVVARIIPWSTSLAPFVALAGNRDFLTPLYGLNVTVGQ